MDAFTHLPENTSKTSFEVIQSRVEDLTFQGFYCSHWGREWACSRSFFVVIFTGTKIFSQIQTCTMRAPDERRKSLIATSSFQRPHLRRFLLPGTIPVVRLTESVMSSSRFISQQPARVSDSFQRKFRAKEQQYKVYGTRNSKMV